MRFEIGRGGSLGRFRKALSCLACVSAFGEGRQHQLLLDGVPGVRSLRRRRRGVVPNRRPTAAGGVQPIGPWSNFTNLRGAAGVPPVPAFGIACPDGAATLRVSRPFVFPRGGGANDGCVTAAGFRSPRAGPQDPRVGRRPQSGLKWPLDPRGPLEEGRGLVPRCLFLSQVGRRFRHHPSTQHRIEHLEGDPLDRMRPTPTDAENEERPVAETEVRNDLAHARFPIQAVAVSLGSAT